jgi:hypothetical protein
MSSTTDDRARRQAELYAESIAATMAAIRRADETGEPQLVEDYDEPQTADELREHAQGDTLDVTISGSWTPGETPKASEFSILLATGGPATRITGELNDDCAEPINAHLEYQDWGTLWTCYGSETPEQADALLDFARLFYFGD